MILEPRYSNSLLGRWQKIEVLEKRLYAHVLHKDPALESLYAAYEKKVHGRCYRYLLVIY